MLRDTGLFTIHNFYIKLTTHRGEGVALFKIRTKTNLKQFLKYLKVSNGGGGGFLQGTNKILYTYYKPKMTYSKEKLNFNA